MDSQTKAILSLIAEMIGQKSVSPECGGDFEGPECNRDNCNHYYDCKRQQKLVSQTQHLEAMIREA